MNKGDVVYIQGLYKGIVEKDVGDSILVRPIEGIANHCKGNIFTYGRSLLKNERSKL